MYPALFSYYIQCGACITKLIYTCTRTVIKKTKDVHFGREGRGHGRTEEHETVFSSLNHFLYTI